MLAHALLALLLPLAQAPDPTCRLVPPVSTGCFNLADLKDKELHVPVNTTRLEPDAIRLCAEQRKEDQDVDLGIVLSASTWHLDQMDSVAKGLDVAFDSLRAGGIPDHVALTVSRIGAQILTPALVPVDQVPDPRIAYEAADALATSTVNSLVYAMSYTRGVLDGSRNTPPSSGSSRLFVIFVHGASEDFLPALEQAFRITSISRPDGPPFDLLPLATETHVVLVGPDDGFPPKFDQLRGDQTTYKFTAHHLADPTSAQVDSLLRELVANRREAPHPDRSVALEARNLDLSVSSWLDPVAPSVLATNPLMDSALPLQEGTNRIELRRTRTGGALVVRDTTRFSVIADGPAGEDSAAPGLPEASWTCASSVLRFDRIPTIDRPLLDLSLETRATGLTVMTSGLVDSAVGGNAGVFLEPSSDARWIGNVEAPLDQSSAPFSISSRGDLVVARWHHPRDPRDSARDSIRINPERKGWIRFTQSELSWPGGSVAATAWIPDGARDSVTATVRCGEGPEKPTVLVRSGETWETSFTVRAGARPWDDTSLSCGDAKPGDSVRVVIRMEGVTGDSLPILDIPTSSEGSLCAVKLRPGSCFDPALLEDHGWLVPRNATHLDLASTTLCLPERKLPAPARIAWVMDNSGSMGQNDPGSIRFQTIWSGINRQVGLNPASEAGFVRFASTIESSVPMAPLQGAQMSRLGQATTSTAPTGGTNWEIALREALRTFSSSQGTGPAAIVMISDGLPNEGIWRNAIRPGMPPVYVLYIGPPASVDLQPDMQQLISLTGGRLWLIGTQPQQAVMNAAVAEIMGLLESKQTPLRATVASMPMRQNARIASFIQSQGGAWVGQADSLLAMVEGGNSFDLQLTTQSAGFPASTRSYQFSLSAQLPAAKGSFDLAGSPFRITCSEPGILRFLDTARHGVDWVRSDTKSVMLDIAPRIAPTSPVPARAQVLSGADASVDLPLRLDEAFGRRRLLGGLKLAGSPSEPGLVLDTLGDTIRGSWCNDRVPRDCAHGTLAVVRVATAPSLRFQVDLLEGPRGSVGIEVRADALAPDTLPVEVSGESGERLTILAVRSPDGVHRATVGFSQIPGPTGPDTIALALPDGRIPAHLVAQVVTLPDTARATTSIGRRRDTLILEPGEEPGTVVVRLVTPDSSSGGRLVVLSGPAGTDSVLLGDDGTAVRGTRPLVGETLDVSRIEGIGIDPLYRDTLRAELKVEPLPSTRIVFAEPLPSGPSGLLRLEARIPTLRDSVVARLSWDGGSRDVVLVRSSGNIFRAILAFSQLPGSTGDSLRLPALRALDLTASIPPSASWRASSDAITLRAPVASWNVVVRDSGRVEVVSDRVAGFATTILSRIDSTDRIHATSPAGTRDSVSIATWTFLGESLDSASVEILRIDPVFGDTSRTTVVVPSQWFPSSLLAAPDTLDPRGDDSTRIEVRDRDLHPDRIDTVEVRSTTGGSWLLVETEANSGVYSSRVGSRELASDWASRPDLDRWTVDLFHADPDHPGDTSRAQVVFAKSRRIPESTAITIAVDDTTATAGTIRLEVVSPTGTDTLLAEIAWEGQRDTLRLVRQADGSFRATLPYSRWAGAGTDTLRLVGGRDLVVSARVLPDSSRTGSADSLGLRSPTVELEATRRDSGVWTVSVDGASGPASVLVVRSRGDSTILDFTRTAEGDSTDVDLERILPESPDSVEIEFLRVDPVFGDTARRTVRVASPWHPASLSVSPDSVDPLRGGTVLVRVVDRDRDSARIDSVEVHGTSKGSWILRETDRGSGVYEARVPVRDLASDWASHPNHEGWSIELVHVDPDHVLDTSRADLRLRKSPAPPETTSIRLRVDDPDAASGTMSLVVESPRGRDTAHVVLSWEGGRDTLELLRDSLDGTFHVDIAYARWPGEGADTLRLPNRRTLSLVATLLPDSSRLGSEDRVELGSHRSELTLERSDSSAWTARVVGAEGPTSNLEIRAADLPSSRIALQRTASGDSARFDPRDFLPESRDSIDLRIVHVDPVYGDTTIRILRVASPWHAASIATDPDSVDVLSGSSVAITVRDRDPHPDRIDAVVVRTSAGTEFVLKETARNSGVYVREVPSWLLDTGWSVRPGNTRWDVELAYVDSAHPGDTARTSVELYRPDLEPSIRVVHGVHPVATSPGSGAPLRAGGLNLLSADQSPDQGLEIDSWIPVDIDVFVYDRIGVWIARGEFRLDPDPVRFTHRFLLSWNGRDQAGIPVSAGIYLARVVVRDRQGRLLSNRVFQLGRRDPARD